MEHLAGTIEGRVVVCEPLIEALPPQLRKHGNISLKTADEARNEADIVVFLVAHRQFKRLDPKTLLGKVVVDSCGLMAGD